MPAASLRAHATSLATRIAGGQTATPAELVAIATSPDEHVEDLTEGIALLMDRVAPKGVHLCSISNIKSGHCTEDCSFCSQARTSRADIQSYPLHSSERMTAFLRSSSEAVIHRLSLVASGRRASVNEVNRIAEALRAAGEGRGRCASLGLLRASDFDVLAAAGLSRYHCNLETSRTHFAQVCSSHTYDQKLETIAAARDAGLSLCVGGLFGMGESDEQVLELALHLREIAPAAVPVNFRVPIAGVALPASVGLTPERCLRIIALLRFALPHQDILVCGGREQCLGGAHPRIFEFGASGIMTGNYLTTDGRSLEEDLALLDRLGLVVRSGEHPSPTAAR